ncbi:hypothetical protein [Amniculibacterium sp. G2-70]|uniref:hypothetical protein n=1 Tax=Amniculibacterium sp. G2-70 TaxID=2767188 RepID=UPI00165420C7|nr:hypothetical protein [Amniculibacterium sp. G2-70]
MADINTILSWFQTGDFPTEAQFRETFLSFMMKGDAVSISQVEGLTEILQQTLSEEQFNNYQFAMATLIDGLAKADGSNIDVELWRTTLGIANIATVDGEADGNVYLKTQTDLKFESLHARLDDLFEILASDDVNLDELQELVNLIKTHQTEIEQLQQISIGNTHDNKVELTGTYEGTGATLQSQLNLIIWDKIEQIEQSLSAIGTTKYTAQIRVNSTLTHNLNSRDLLVVGYDAVTGYSVPLRHKVNASDANVVDVEFDSEPLNFVKITIKKL